MCRTWAVHRNIPKVEIERFWPTRLTCLSDKWKSHKLARNQSWKQCINGPEAMKHSEPHVDFTILVIQLFRSVSSCPYRKDGLFVDTNLQQSEGLVPRKWARNHGSSLFKALSQQQMNGCSGFSSSVSLLRSLLNCFRLCFQVFKASWYLANLWQVSLTSQTLSISVLALIAYRIQTLEAICAGMEMERVWHVRLGMQSRCNQHELMVQRPLINWGEPERAPH